MSNNIFKIIFLGDVGVGKTSILKRYFDNSFDENITTTIGVGFFDKKIVITEKIHYQYWDTSGHENFESITDRYCKGVDVAVIVYDITNSNTFDSIRKWHKKVINYSNAIIFIVGNKCELHNDRKVLTNDIKKIAKEYNSAFIETSAKSGKNIKELFEMIQKSLYSKLDWYNLEPENKFYLTKAETNQNFTLCCI